jgi:hypothetical protein
MAGGKKQAHVVPKAKAKASQALKRQASAPAEPLLPSKNDPEPKAAVTEKDTLPDDLEKIIDVAVAAVEEEIDAEAVAETDTLSKDLEKIIDIDAAAAVVKEDTLSNVVPKEKAKASQALKRQASAPAEPLLLSKKTTKDPEPKAAVTEKDTLPDDLEKIIDAAVTAVAEKIDVETVAETDTPSKDLEKIIIDIDAAAAVVKEDTLSNDLEETIDVCEKHPGTEKGLGIPDTLLLILVVLTLELRCCLSCSVTGWFVVS